MRMELTDFWAVLFNPDAQAKFVHTVSAGYVTGAVFVLAISSWYLLHGRDVEFAKRSFRIAAAFGLASVLSVIVLGDESGYTVGEAQQTKMAAIEAMWETDPAPAPFTVIAAPNEAAARNDWEVQIPWVMGIIGTRSITQQIPGIRQIKERNRARDRLGHRGRHGARDPAGRSVRRRRARALRGAQGRPGLRPAAQALRRPRPGCDAGADPAGGRRDGAAGGADVLELPPDGCAGRC